MKLWDIENGHVSHLTIEYLIIKHKTFIIICRLLKKKPLAREVLISLFEMLNTKFVHLWQSGVTYSSLYHPSPVQQRKTFEVVRVISIARQNSTADFGTTLKIHITLREIAHFFHSPPHQLALLVYKYCTALINVRVRLSIHFYSPLFGVCKPLRREM